MDTALKAVGLGAAGGLSKLQKLELSQKLRAGIVRFYPQQLSSPNSKIPCAPVQPFPRFVVPIDCSSAVNG
jgi:hypothetical protein